MGDMGHLVLSPALPATEPAPAAAEPSQGRRGGRIGFLRSSKDSGCPSNSSGRPPLASSQKSKPASKASKNSLPSPDQLPSPRLPSVKRSRHVEFGQKLMDDVRIENLIAREEYMLRVVMPRHRTWHHSLLEWRLRTTASTVWVPCVLVLMLHVGWLVGCTISPLSDVCAGGPVGDDADERWWSSKAFVDYGPPMVNALSTLMLSFYANVCMGLYKEGYSAAQGVRESILDIMAMVAGTIPPYAREVRLEFWRCINLYHLCSWVLSDKSRETYNIDNFLIPVATAYGEQDGDTRFGMLTLDEIETLASRKVTPKAPQASEPSRFNRMRLTSGPRSNTAPRLGRSNSITKLGSSRIRERESIQHALGDDSVKQLDHEAAAVKAVASRTPKCGRRGSSVLVRRGSAKSGTVRLGMPNSRWSPPGDATLAEQSQYRGIAATSDLLANSQGDVSSSVAVLHAALGVRMYMLVDLVLEEKLSRAAWPAWNAVCLKMRSNADGLKQRALFRLPRIYRLSVRFLVASTILTDTLLLASHAAMLQAHAREETEWQGHAYFGTALDLLVNLLLTWFLTIFLDGIDDMQTPFGGGTLDMPGLTYVCAAAEISLRTAIGDESAESGGASVRYRQQGDAKTAKIFSILNGPLERKELLAGTMRKREEAAAAEAAAAEAAAAEAAMQGNAGGVAIPLRPKGTKDDEVEEADDGGDE